VKLRAELALPIRRCWPSVGLCTLPSDRVRGAHRGGRSIAPPADPGRAPREGLADASAPTAPADAGLATRFVGT
jgi:hypothetical protein